MQKCLRFLVFAAILGAPIFTFADEATTTPEIATSTPSTVTITIRDGDITAFTGAVEIATSTTPAMDIAPTNSSTTVSVAADSLLATLVTLDATKTEFDITDLGYFSSFGSFIINCISFPAATSTNCFNWTYAVNGAFPQVGIDDTILHDGDVVYLFFGPQRQTTLSTTTATVDEGFTAIAQKYDLASGTYVGVQGVVIGVGIANPDFSFTEFATSTSDVNGNAAFSMNATGTFAVGIQEDFYFPASSITIVEAPATTTDATSAPPVDNPPPTGGGGGISHFQLNVPNALAYLVSKQHADGSFDSAVLTDWAAIAFAASDPGAPKELLKNYLLSSTPPLSSVTDYERHAMALMALGIDPYSGTSINYIGHITEAFDGTQIGDVHLDNDDIFALFPLLRAGYFASDEIIQKTTSFILSAQNTNGAWDASVDMTAAAIQALSQVTSLPNVSAALTKAESYLRSQQKFNGGLDNSFSTGWTLQAIAALNQTTATWAPSGYNPNDYLASLQQSDGGLEPTSSDAQTRIWATEYAIPASLGKPWSSLLQSFPKPAGPTTSGGGAVLGTSTSTVATTSATTTATSSPIVATTTQPVATSTPVMPETIASSTPVVETVKTTITQSKPIAKTPTPKITVATPTPPTSTPSTSVAQTAGAATPPGNFFTKLWHAVTSFFSSLF